MKLVYFLQRKSYFLEHELAWYRIGSVAEVERALTSFPLVTADAYDMVAQPHQRGIARVEADPDATAAAVVVTLSTVDGELLERISRPIDPSCLTSVDWLPGRFRDGWIGSDIAIDCDGMRSLRLRVFLPEADGRGAKTLEVREQPGGARRTFSLARGAETEVDLVEEPFEGTRCLNLRCEPETITRSSDQRQLGFVLVEQFVEAA